MTRTKKLKLSAVLLTLLSFVLSFGPLIVYTVLAYNSAMATDLAKITLTSMLSIGVILGIVSILTKYIPRCIPWLILIGLFVCLDHFIGCVLVFAITQCVDELLISPMAKKYRHLYTINKEIDKRG